MLTSLLLVPTAQAVVEMQMIEDAFEEAALKIRLDKSLHGIVIGKVCDLCEEQEVKITPQTKAYEKGKEVPLIEAKKRFGKSALVLFDIKTKIVTRIQW